MADNQNDNLLFVVDSFHWVGSRSPALPVTSAMVLWMILMLEAVTIWDIEKLKLVGVIWLLLLDFMIFHDIPYTSWHVLRVSCLKSRCFTSGARGDATVIA